MKKKNQYKNWENYCTVIIRENLLRGNIEHKNWNCNSNWILFENFEEFSWSVETCLHQINLYKIMQHSNVWSTKTQLEIEKMQLQNATGYMFINSQQPNPKIRVLWIVWDFSQTMPIYSVT